MNEFETLFSLQGKRALISGGTGGLGSAIAKAFLRQGVQVAVCTGHLDKAQPLFKLAQSLNQKAFAFECDLTQPEQINRLLDQVERQMGSIDILVNSAGINRLLPAEDYSDEVFSQVLDLNLKGLHTLTRETGRRFMIPSRYGRILNLSSVKSIIGTSKDYLAYCASKGAVNMYTRQLACEWGKYQITCNAIAPTFVRTPINAFQLDDPDFYQSLTRRIPLGRIGTECDIAAAALFLCSDAAAFISGQILCVDGGLTAMQ